MQYRTFPRIPDLPISVLGFGCMRLPVIGGDMTKIDDAQAIPLLHRAIDAGVNYVDTAYPYHGGESERFVARALKGGYREKVQLATKLPTWLVQSEGDWERLLEEQLIKLEADHIDFYLLHALSTERWDTVKRLRGLKALERAKADGRIRHFGFSFHDSLKSFKEIIDGYDWEFCQIQYNFLDQDYQAGAEGLAYAAARQVGVISMEPLRGGTLAVPQPEGVQAIWSRSQAQRPPADRALRWVWNHPEVVTALSGMNADIQLQENLAAAAEGLPGSLDSGELALFEEVRQYYAARTAVPCTTCGYCTPCPHGVAIPEAFSSFNTGSMFGTWKASAWVYDNYVVRAGHGADQCVECGDCEPKCPQQISIMTKLKEAHRALTAAI
ncbi:MAG: aldo/keto reductase [Holophagaceae bacterium]|nr:aldo/keto reductase [Holophagaceae bacterium]